MTDTDLMPFGKHKGTAMANVPASYLLYMYDTFWRGSVPGEDTNRVKKYVIENYEVLQQEARKAKQESQAYRGRTR